VALTDLEYQKLVKALVGKCNEKLKNLNRESSRMWSHITSRYFDFNQLKNDSVLISEISKLELLAFYDENILGKDRRRASVHLKSLKIEKVYDEGVKNEMLNFLKDSTVLDDVERFKETLGLTKDVLPLHPLASFK
jgi:insulysin